MKIIIFDGSFKTTPFINRLAQGLAINHAVYIMGFNETLSRKIDSIEYVPLGSNTNKFRFALTSLNWVFKLRKFNLLLSTLKSLIYGQRQILQQQNLQLALKNIKPDIIHLQWPSVISNFEEILLEQKIPVVLSQRGYHNNVRPFVNAANYQYLKKWYPKIAGFHSVSKAISKEGDKIYNSPSKIDEVVYTGLDLKGFTMPESFSKNETIKLLSVGRPHWKKGYDYALFACTILKSRNIKFQYTIIGATNNEELLFIIDNLHLSNEITLTDKMEQQKVYEYMLNSDLLLLPSVEEGIANVVVEAMALGLPVISSDCGGMDEVIIDGENGWIFPKRNASELANVIENFRNLPITELHKLRFSARKKVEDQHQTLTMITNMENLYKSVLK